MLKFYILSIQKVLLNFNYLYNKKFIIYFRRILRTQPPIPSSLSSEVKDFITKLLEKDPRKRLGGGPEDSLMLKQHPFFKVVRIKFSF